MRRPIISPCGMFLNKMLIKLLIISIQQAVSSYRVMPTCLPTIIRKVFKMKHNKKVMSVELNEFLHIIEPTPLDKHKRELYECKEIIDFVKDTETI